MRLSFSIFSLCYYIIPGNIKNHLCIQNCCACKHQFFKFREVWKSVTKHSHYQKLNHINLKLNVYIKNQRQYILKTHQLWSSLVTQKFKDPELLPLWLYPWSRNFHMPWPWPKKRNQLLVTFMHFPFIYVLEVVYIYYLFVVEIPHNGILLISLLKSSQWCHINTLKWAMEEVFIPWKSENTVNRLLRGVGNGCQGSVVKHLPEYHCT